MVNQTKVRLKQYVTLAGLRTFRRLDSIR